jgi:cytochrome oxidase Cu insertion factor (SCO1/SenC/PrrC family)
MIALISLLILAAGCAMLETDGKGKTEYETLKIGLEAPDFWLKNQDQQRISLSDFRGKKSVVLVFFPLAFTPV